MAGTTWTRQSSEPKRDAKSAAVVSASSECVLKSIGETITLGGSIIVSGRGDFRFVAG
jgi:hypothetical protein